MMKSGKFAAVFAVFALGLGSAVHAAPPPQQQTVAAATGSVAPELDVAAWAQGGEVRLSELKGKKYAVLFFWTISKQGTENFADVAKLAKEYEKKDVVFIGIGIDSADAVKNFIRLKELPFSVAADDKLASVNLYMRERDRVPMAAVIGRDGLLYWRGQPQVLKPVLDEVLSGKFDLKGRIERENFSQSVMDAMKIKDYPTVLKLLDAELGIYPDNMELVSLKVRLLASLMNKPGRRPSGTAGSTAGDGFPIPPIRLSILILRNKTHGETETALQRQRLRWERSKLREALRAVISETR